MINIPICIYCRRCVVMNLVRLVERDECTVPFVVRYRKEQTKGMDVDQVKEFVDTLNELR